MTRLIQTDESLERLSQRPQIYLRYQDKEGRGPFRPGMTARWADPKGKGEPPVFKRFPDFRRYVDAAHRKGLFLGCALCGWASLDRYFTASEQGRLARLGHKVHRVPASAVILSDGYEVVFAHHRPLATLPRAMRPDPQRRRQHVDDCPTCEKAMREGHSNHPPHDPSPNCQSGGRTHCSCDVCF